MRGSPVVAATLFIWFALAVAVGVAGWFQDISWPVLPGTIGTLSALTLIACWRVRPISDWAARVDLRWLVLLHVTRFVGIYFLILSQRGTIPARWALPAGIGDIVIAACALLLIALRVPRVPLAIWNAAGLIDILFVIGSGLRLGLQDWNSTAFLRHLPLVMLPLFLVPLIVATHMWIFVRLPRRPPLELASQG